MIRAVVIAAIIALVGFAWMVPAGGIWLVALAVVLAYVQGRSDEHDRRDRARPGYVSGSNGVPHA